MLVMCVYVCTARERERERERGHVYMYIYTHTYTYVDILYVFMCICISIYIYTHGNASVSSFSRACFSLGSRPKLGDGEVGRVHGLPGRGSHRMAYIPMNTDTWVVVKLMVPFKESMLKRI